MKIAINIRNRHLFIGDLGLTVLSIIFAYILRLELVEIFANYYLSLLWMIGLSLVIKPVVYYFFGLYRRMWIYASMKEMRLIIVAVTVASAIVSPIMLILFANRFFISFPRSVLIIDWFTSILLIGGSRYGLRMLAEAVNKNDQLPRPLLSKNTLIIGAGDAGALVAKELLKNPTINLKPVGFLDDNPEKQRQQIHGIPVVGKLKDLPKVIGQRHIGEVIIAIPSGPGNIIRSVSEICRKKQIPYRTMPGIYELLGGRVSVTRLREVDISDLLQREPAPINDEIVGGILRIKWSWSPGQAVRSVRNSAGKLPVGSRPGLSYWGMARTASSKRIWN
jgi:FlaA1/EpsC-like NDP-sugar epimerase